MYKNEIVEALGKDKVVEKIAAHYNTPYREDLCQYIYLYMLETMDEERLNDLYQTGRIKQFIAGMIYKQIFSTKSNHYKENVRKIESINKENKDGKPYEETLVYDDTDYNSVTKEVDDFLNTLNDMEKQMVRL